MRLDLTPNGGTNGGGGGIGGGVRRLRHPNLEKMKSFNSKECEEEAMFGDGDENGADYSETGMDQATADRIEEARLAEEALASNLKLLKKQKAKFLRLQKILSRNVFLIPMCAIFSVLSAATIFFSTLSHNFEHTIYDMSRLSSLIESENNKSMSDLSAALKALNRSLPLSAHEYSNNDQLVQAVKTLHSNDLADDPAPNAQSLSSIYSKDHHEHYEAEEAEKQAPHQQEFFQEIQFHGPQQIFNVHDSHQQRRATTTPATSSAKRMQNFYFYSLRNYSDHSVISRHTNSLLDNSSIKYNLIYPTYSGVWCFCNTLSGKQP